MSAPRHMRTRSDVAAERAVDEALARSVLYRALAHGFGPVAAAPVEGHDALRHAARFLSSGPLHEAVERLLSRSELSAAQRAEGHARVFGHSGGFALPFETEYGPEGGFQQPHALADVAGYYRAFGLGPRPRTDVRADHVACECEFMGFLARKQAFLLATSPEDTETLEAVRGATRGFLRDHLGRFGRAFASRLRAEDGGGYYAGLGELLLAVLDVECARLDLPPGPASLTLRPAAPDPAPMACGECVER